MKRMHLFTHLQHKLRLHNFIMHEHKEHIVIDGVEGEDECAVTVSGRDTDRSRVAAWCSRKVPTVKAEPTQSTATSRYIS